MRVQGESKEPVEDFLEEHDTQGGTVPPWVSRAEEQEGGIGSVTRPRTGATAGAWEQAKGPAHMGTGAKSTAIICHLSTLRPTVHWTGPGMRCVRKTRREDSRS